MSRGWALYVVGVWVLLWTVIVWQDCLVMAGAIPQW